MSKDTYAVGLAIRLAHAMYDEDDKAYRDNLERLTFALDGAEPGMISDVINGNVPGEEESLLHCAAGSASTEAALKLIEWGADVDALDDKGDLPIHRALWQNRWTSTEEIVLALVEAGCDCGAHGFYERTPLHLAAAHGSPAVVAALIAAGADVNALDTGDNGLVPLHEAAEDGNTAAIPLLLAAGATPDQVTASGETDLLLAVTYGHLEAARELIAAGCDVDYADPRGRTALHFAARNGDTELVRLLADVDADFYAADDLGQTPLQILAAFGEQELIEAMGGAAPSIGLEQRLSVYLSLILQNSSGTDDYVESSFVAVLHERSMWLVNRWKRLEAALAGLAEDQSNRGFISRALAGNCQFLAQYIIGAVSHHISVNDGFKIGNLDDDTIYDLGQDAETAFLRFFDGGAPGGVEMTVDSLLGKELEARDYSATSDADV